MDMTEHCTAIHKKANQMRGALWSLVLAAIAAYLVWSFGSGAPWWVYALLFARSVVGFAQVLTSDCFCEQRVSAGDAAICDLDSTTAWEASGLSAD